MEPKPPQSPELQKFWRQDIAKPRALRFQYRAKVDPPKLTSPLSELTKHLTHIPIRDMESWVHRPIEVRLHRVSKMSGRIARPMNCFMLYRSAYAERTKEWVSKTNHQVVSQLAGKSWKLETAEIKKEYGRLATIEKNNHVKAHPGYKFSPQVKSKRVKQEDKQSPSISHSNTSGSSPALTQNRIMDSMEFDSRKSHGSSPLSLVEHGLPSTTYLNSVWPIRNLDRLSSEMVQTAEPSRCPQQPHHPQYLKGPHIGNVRFSGVELQDLQYSSSMALVGLPETTSHDLLSFPAPTQPASTGNTVDPQLLSFHGYPSIPVAGGCAYSSSRDPK